MSTSIDVINVRKKIIEKVNAFLSKNKKTVRKRE